MSDTPTTSAIVAAVDPPALLRPIAQPALVIQAHKEAVALIQEALESGRDYGVIPGTGDKPTLLKAGAERLLGSFGLYSDFSVVEQEVDHDRVNRYSQKRWVGAKKPSEDEQARMKAAGTGRFRKGDNGWVWQQAEVEEGESSGLYRYVVRCEIRSRQDHRVVGSGLGACSTMESKYVRAPRDFENTVLKMAKKRALVDATLSTLALSDRFTQDVEDIAPSAMGTDAAQATPKEEGAKSAQTAWWQSQGGTPAQWGQLGGRSAPIHELVAEARDAGCQTVADVIAYVQDGVVPGALVEDDGPGNQAGADTATEAPAPSASGTGSEPFGAGGYAGLAAYELTEAQYRKLRAAAKTTGRDLVRLAEECETKTFDALFDVLTGAVTA